MLNRWLGILSAAAMLLANGAVLMRDVVPGLIAGDPPPPAATRLAPGSTSFTQTGIFDRTGRHIGRSWSIYKRMQVGGISTMQTITVLEPIHLPSGVGAPPACIQIKVTYRDPDMAQRAADAPAPEVRVDELDFRLFGLGVPVSFRGEAYETGDFPCSWEVGDRRGSFVLDSTAPAALGDVIRPFDRLPQLYVGRSWRVELLDPLAQLLPNIDTSGLGFESILIQVTGKETISFRGRSVETFVVEGGGARAWVAEDGRVLKQMVEIPLLGQLTLLDEPFEEKTLREAIRPYPVEVLTRPEVTATSNE